MTTVIKNFTSMDEHLEQLKSCKYECEAGPLELNRSFLAIEKTLKSQERIRQLLRAAIDGPWRGEMLDEARELLS